MKQNTTIIAVVCSLLLTACGSTIDQQALIEKYTSAHSRFIDLGGNRIHYRDEGQGEVVVLLHGTASSLHTWDYWAQELSKHYRVIRMDLPGFGLTGPDYRDRYEVADDIAFLNNFLARLAVERVHLVGSSLGGRIAWDYSIANPRQVKTLTLINSLGYPQKRWPPAIELAQWPVMDSVMTHVSPRFLYETGLKEVYFDEQQVTDSLVDRYYELSRYPGNLEAFPKRVSAKLDTQADKITQISVPTLVLWGQEDIYFPVESAHRFHQDIATSTLQVYPSVGHLPMEEVPEQSLGDFVKFINDK